MKKLYFSALSIVFGLSLNAQTINQGNHAPTNGDRYGTYQVDSSFVPSAISGAGVTWNYALVTHSSIVSNYSVTTNANPAYTLATTSNAASGSNIQYYKDSPTELKNFGGYLNLNGISGTVNYTTPAVAMAYPTSMGTSTTSTTGGTLSALGQPGTFTGTCNSTADATGTLVLPSKTFSSVIRVVTSQTLIFSIPGVGVSNGTITQKTYDYYSLADSKFPILSHLTNFVNAPPVASASSQSIATVQKSYQSVGVKENAKEEVALNVYPNPSGSIVNFVTENNNAASVSVHDINGKLIESAILTNGKLNLNVSGYSNGIYIYKLLDANKAALKTGKLTVTH